VRTAALLTVLLLAAAAPARADFTPPPSSQEANPAPPPAASTAPAVATDTATADVAVSTGGVKIAGTAPKPALKRPIRAHIHRAARSWTPVSLREAGDPLQAETFATLGVHRARKRWTGRTLKATATARLYKEGENRWLVVSVFPKPADPVLKRRALHFEVRLRIVVGYVEEVRAVAVLLSPRDAARGRGLNARELDARGISYEESSPASGEVRLSALDPRPSRSAFNAGVLRHASFGLRGVGLADASWKVKGLR
jgi:hypothetical protein